MRAMVRIAVAVCTVCVVGAAWGGSASAQNNDAKKAEAKAVYAQAKTAYDLGKWDEAIRLFQKTYGIYPFRNVLFDIGQANRHGERCKDAVFFYKRFLQVKPDTPNRAEVEGFIKECTEKLAAQPNGGGTTAPDPGVGTKPADPTGPGTGTGIADPGTGTGTTGTTGTTGSSVSETASPAPSASLIVATVQLGPAFVGLLDDESTPVQPTFDVSFAYPLRVGPVSVEAGVHFGYTRVPWETADMSADGELGLLSLTAGAAASYEVIDRLSVRGELGIGDLVMLGVDEAQNPFTDREFDSAAASLFHFRIALGVEYAVMDNLVITAHPVTFWRASPVDGLAEDISQITQLSVMAGVSYRR